MAAGVAAFAIWGMLPLYWQPMIGIPASEILAQRIVWSLLTMLPLIWWTARWAEIHAALASAYVMRRIVCSTLCIGVNWAMYLYAMTNGHVIEASLGYYINPLANVVLGRVLLRERLTRLQWMAVGLAALGVAMSVLAYGRAPYLALGLGFTFAMYGFIRKTVQVESAPGLFLETLLLFPFALAWLAWLVYSGDSHFGDAGFTIQALYVGSGLVTSAPLIFFAYAARHLTLSTLGLLQYIAPTGTFLLGVFVFDEPVRAASLATFACIWCALALYTWCSLRTLRSTAGHKA